MQNVLLLAVAILSQSQCDALVVDEAGVFLGDFAQVENAA